MVAIGCTETQSHDLLGYALLLFMLVNILFLQAGLRQETQHNGANPAYE